jgi:hypothetical protein
LLNAPTEAVIVPAWNVVPAQSLMKTVVSPVISRKALTAFSVIPGEPEYNFRVSWPLGPCFRSNMEPVDI